MITRFSLLSILISGLQLVAAPLCYEYNVQKIRQALNNGAQLKEFILENGDRITITPYKKLLFTGAHLELFHDNKLVADVDVDYLFTKKIVFGWDLWVKPSERRKGFGTVIGNAAAHYLKLIDAQKVYWIAQPFGKAAISINDLSNGYKKSGGTQLFKIPFFNAALFSCEISTYNPNLPIKQVIIEY